jgi:hypothetical protein
VKRARASARASRPTFEQDDDCWRIVRLSGIIERTTTTTTSKTTEDKVILCRLQEANEMFGREEEKRLPVDRSDGVQVSRVKAVLVERMLSKGSR